MDMLQATFRYRKVPQRLHSLERLLCDLLIGGGGGAYTGEGVNTFIRDFTSAEEVVYHLIAYQNISFAVEP